MDKSDKTQESFQPSADLAPPDYCDPVIEAYKRHVDRTLLRENLKLSVEERLRNAAKANEAVDALRAAGEKQRAAEAAKKA
jgi:hypothetical protein